MAGVIKVGPWGGSGGSPVDVGPASRIQTISVSHGYVVDRITVYYVDADGKTFDIVIGGTGGGESKFHLGDDEYLNSMSGSFELFERHVVVTQLSLGSNKGNVYGPYGNGGGTAFSLPVVGGKISNFFGRGGAHVDAIGAYVALIS